MKKISKETLRKKSRGSPIILSPVKVPPMRGQSFVEALARVIRKDD